MNTPHHIKRFEEYAAQEMNQFPGKSPRIIFEDSAADMLNNLAEHIERLEKRLEEKK